MRENADQNNSEHGHFLRSDIKWEPEMEHWCSPVPILAQGKDKPLTYFMLEVAIRRCKNFAIFVEKHL